jgi:hypothetical protein
MAADLSLALSTSFHRVQATMISLACFKKEKNIFSTLKNNIAFLEKSFETGFCIGDKK